MDCLRSSLVVVTLFLFLSFQIKADIDIDAIISLLKLGEANATATFEYLSEGNPRNASAESRARCTKWYSQVPYKLHDSIDDLKQNKISTAAHDVEIADEFNKSCQDEHIEDPTLSSSIDYIRDICQKVLKEL
ncbi:hypothetical protein RDI58_024701 [Solanum bulbocastanum]|uniref:Pectinesterase inhibitor domain-containing protein n=1 Tax=Solanum bulbocastanum TaxID=147425 RepID=A0AAN8T5F0_SOLBU